MFYWNNEIYKHIKPEFIDNCKKREALPFNVNKNSNGKGILILGINPSGGDSAVSEEKASNFIYLYYLDSIKPDIKNVTYKKYFKSLYDELISKVFDNNVKWDWCNSDWNVIQSKINNNKRLKKYYEKIKNYYEEHKSKDYTIYIGDLIYIHETKQKNILKWINQNNEFEEDYIKKSFNAHIDLLIQAGVKDLIIYINNAKVSKWISKIFNSNKQESHFIYTYKNNKYPIVLGSMIQGQRAMDVFSRDRLIKELRDNIKKV